jgi:thiosulfate reductase cytochrome b subunit
MGEHKIYLYPVWVRVWHGVNALSIIVLIATGISMQYSNPDYPIIRFDLAVLFHNIFGVLTAFSYLFFFAANLLTGNAKSYILNINGLIDRLIIQSKYYLFGYFKGEPKPFPISRDDKFNPLQKVAYIGTMYMLVPLVIITGIALLFPEMIIENVFEASGIKITAIFHAALGFLISLFLVIHLYVASVGKHPMKNYRSIITGYHED